jgi:hypothetical protein
MQPMARLRTGKSWGSGSIIRSERNAEGCWSTYALTNYHVVEDNIEREQDWDDILRKKIEVDRLRLVPVEVFTYQYRQRSIGSKTVQADIMTYDPKHDLALLRLRDEEAQYEAVQLFPEGAEAYAWLQPGMPVISVGCGLGQAPVQAPGILSKFGQEIDGVEYWLNSGLSIFGNSGGALFLGDVGQMFPDSEEAVERQFSLIGVPSKVAVRGTFFGDQPITHLSYAAPASRIYQFLEKKMFRFIYDDSHTEETEAALRKELREEERYREKGR